MIDMETRDSPRGFVNAMIHDIFEPGHCYSPLMIAAFFSQKNTGRPHSLEDRHDSHSASGAGKALMCDACALVREVEGAEAGRAAVGGGK